jgi:hypothetical protein
MQALKATNVPLSTDLAKLYILLHAQHNMLSFALNSKYFIICNYVYIYILGEFKILSCYEFLT